MTDDPLVSVVLPTYDRPEFLTRAVDSVATQTYDRVELVVVDDHSPSPVGPLLEDRSPTDLEAVNCIRHDDNRGANAARNTGIRAASGELIGFIDDDDRWRRDKIERQVDTFRRAADDVGAVFTDERMVNGDGDLITEMQTVPTGEFTANLIEGRYFGSFSTVLVDEAVVRRAGLPDERLPAWQDLEWYFRLSAECDYEVVSEPLSISENGDRKQVSDDYEGKRDVSYHRILNKHRRLAARLGDRYERTMVATMSRRVAKSALAHGRHREALGYLWRSLRNRPDVPETYLYLALALGGERSYELAKRVKRGYARRILG
jgi:glycosyltransferase involved in cell wall biosynthesis